MRKTAWLFALLASSAPLTADDVHLVNGQVFSGVTARVDGGAVEVRLPGGTLRLRLAQVERIVPSEAPWEAFLARREALARDPEARVADWLDLAHWAQRQGLEQGHREAVLAAAALSPLAADVAPPLRALGYVLDAELERWLPYEDAMRRRGFVQAEGQWLSPQEAAEREVRRRRARAEAAAERELELRREMARTTEALLALETVRAKQTPPTVIYVGTIGWPMVWAPAPQARPPGHGGHRPPPEATPRPPSRPTPHTIDGIGGRQPGSLLPVDRLSSGAPGGRR